MKERNKIIAGALLFALMLSVAIISVLSIPQAEPTMNPISVKPLGTVNPASNGLPGDTNILHNYANEEKLLLNTDVVHTNPDGLSMSYSKYDSNYSVNHVVWFAGQSYAPIQAYLVRYNESSKTFTNIYLNDDHRAYFIADNETHVVTSTIGYANSTLFLIKKADLSVTSYPIPRCGYTSAVWVASFDSSGDIWMGTWSLFETNDAILNLHFSNGTPQWAKYDNTVDYRELPTQGITNGIYGNAVWFVKQGSGRLSRFDITNHTITDYLIDSNANQFPTKYLSPGVISFHSSCIWIAGYGLGKIYRFDLKLYSVQTIEVSEVLGPNILSCAPLAAFNQTVFLLSKSYPHTGFIWNTTIPFNSTNVKAINIDNYGIPSLSYIAGLCDEIPGFHIYADSLITWEETVRFGSSITEFDLEVKL